MPEQYDVLASTYDDWIKMPGEAIPPRMFQRVVQSASGLRVLDLGCGTGQYSRMLVEMGAKQVIGIDISPKMTAIAQSTPSPIPTATISYQNTDCGKPFVISQSSFEPTESEDTVPATFDLVTACWLLGYAPDLSTLTTMLQNISNHLKPSGRFVGLIENHDSYCTGYQEKYGMTISRREPLEQGGYKLWHVVHIPGTPTEFQNYILPKSMYEQAAAQAGFIDVKFELPGYRDLLPAEMEQQDFWRDFLEGGSFAMVMSAKKRAQGRP